MCGEPSGYVVTNGPCRTPSALVQYHVGSGARATARDAAPSQVSLGSSGASGTAASTGTTCAVRGCRGGCSGGCGGSCGAALGVLGPEPHAAADVKMQTTVWRRTTSLLCTNSGFRAIRALG